jgi:Arc/MetJ-type ribon-helix-helix transcriptional regulator
MSGLVGGFVPEVRVTIDEKLDSYLSEIVDSGLYPSKAEFMRCGMVHLLKELNLLQYVININKNPET